MTTPSNAPRVVLTDRFAEALDLAFRLHRYQRRKGSEVPYVSHLLAVTALVLEDGGDEEEAIAALLHDAVEDHPEEISLDGIRDRFGERVAEIVRGCTDTPPEYTGGVKPPWLERKTAYLAHIRAGGESLRVSLADKLHNTRTILADRERVGEEVWSRFTASKEQTLWYYRSLVDAFRAAGVDSPLLAELERGVEKLQS